MSMKTIFLASGKSSRCAPLSDKNFLEFCGKPLMLHLLENARAGGLENFIIVSNGENLDQIKTVCANIDFLQNVEIVVQPNLEEGMAGGILAGLERVADTDSVFIMGGNDYVESAVYSKMRTQAKGHDGAILAKHMDTYFPGGYLEIDNKAKILAMIEKPGEGNEPSNLVNIVAHFFQKSSDLKTALSLAKSDKDDVYETALDHLFKTKNFVATEYKGTWQAIKYPWQVLEMMSVFLEKQVSSTHPTAQIAASAVIKGPKVVIEKGAKVFDNAVIQGPCYIGEKAVIGNNALVRGSNIGANSGAGYNTEIARSFLSREVSSHIAYIGDSVIDAGANFGAYSCTANLRLDKSTVQVKIKGDRVDSHHQKLGAIVGKGVQIGVHAMLMPGVKVADHVVPGVVVK